MEMSGYVCPECGCRVFTLIEEHRYYMYMSKGVWHRSLKDTHYMVKCNNPGCKGIYRREILARMDKMTNGFSNIVDK